VRDLGGEKEILAGNRAAAQGATEAGPHRCLRAVEVRAIKVPEARIDGFFDESRNLVERQLFA